MTSDMSPGFGSGYADDALWELVDKGLTDRLAASKAPDALRRLSGRGLNRSLGDSGGRVRRVRPEKPAAGGGVQRESLPPPRAADRDVSRGSGVPAMADTPQRVPFKPAEAAQRKPSGRGWGDFEAQARSGMVGSGAPWADKARAAESARRPAGDGGLDELRRLRAAAQFGRFNRPAPPPPPPSSRRMGSRPAPAPAPEAAAPAASGGAVNPWVWGGLAGAAGAGGVGGGVAYNRRKG